MSNEKLSKSTRLIYIVIFMWVFFAGMGLYFEANLAQLAGYYASLTLFVSTYLWGEYKRLSEKSGVFKKGKSSSREITIYITVFLWFVTGTLGILFSADINQLTVYFAALTPFVSSYLIYKTNKGADLPIFDGETQSLKDNSLESAGMETTVKRERPSFNREEVKEPIEDKPITIDPRNIEEEDEVF